MEREKGKHKMPPPEGDKVPSKTNPDSEQVIVPGESAATTKSKQNFGEHYEVNADNRLKATGEPFEDGDAEVPRTGNTDEREKRTDSGEDNDYAGRGEINKS